MTPHRLKTTAGGVSDSSPEIAKQRVVVENVRTSANGSFLTAHVRLSVTCEHGHTYRAYRRIRTRRRDAAD